MDLPDGWAWTRIEEIATLIRGVSYNKNEVSEMPKVGFIPILRATNIQDEHLLLNSSLVFAPIQRVNAEQLLKAGDVVICISSGSKHLVGKAAQLTQDWEGSFGTFCAAARFIPKIHPRFAGYFFSSPVYRDEIRKKSSGINIYNLRINNIGEIPFPLPPLAEQERIVERIESLFTQLEAGVAGLKRAQTALKRYRASVLKAACEGRLVAQDLEDEPAEELLRRMGKDQLRREDLPELPVGWVWVTIGDLSDNIQYGYTESANEEPIGPKFLRITDIQDGSVNWDEVPYCKISEENIGKYLLQPGDIVFARTGATTGKSFLIINCPKSVFASYLIRLRLHDVFDVKYLALFLDSPVYWSQIMTVRKGSAQPGVNATILATLNVSLPPSAEQRRIVAEVERRLSVVAELEAAVAASLRRAGRLRQAILKRAFEGRLVAQEVGDEPAQLINPLQTPASKDNPEQLRLIDKKV